jgi:hypothetical protein
MLNPYALRLFNKVGSHEDCKVLAQLTERGLAQDLMRGRTELRAPKRVKLCDGFTVSIALHRYILLRIL